MLGTWPRGLGCIGGGFHDLFNWWNNAGSSVGLNCDLLDNPSAGDTVALYIYVVTSGSGLGQVCMEVYDWTSGNINDQCVNQPDPGSTPSQNYFVFLPYLRELQRLLHGSDDGGCLIRRQPRAWIISAMPTATYYWGGTSRGAPFDVASYVPWSDEWVPATSMICYDHASPSPMSAIYYTVIDAEVFDLSRYFEASGGSVYGPHWVAGQETQSGWRFQTDVVPLSSPSIGESRSSLDSGQFVTLYGGAGGGVGGYVFLLAIGGPFTTGQYTGGSADFNPPYTGSYSTDALVTDALGDSNVSTTGPGFLVLGDPSVESLSPSSPSIDLGQSVAFTATVSGGSGGYTYAWFGLPPGCAPVSAGSITCTPTALGTYSITASVTDSNGFTPTSGALAYTVKIDPTLSGISPSRGTVDIGQTVTFTITASGGSGDYAYAWNGLPTGCTSSGTASDLCTPTGAGAFSVTVTLTDSNGWRLTSSAFSYLVESDPTATAPVGSPPSIDLGQSVTFTTTATGGSGGYSYAWSGLPTGCVNPAAATDSCTPTGSGTFSVTITVTDSNGYAITSALSYRVAPDPTVGTPSALPTSGGVDVGQSVTFLATSGSLGSGSYSYAWSGLPTGCSNTGTDVAQLHPDGFGIVHGFGNRDGLQRFDRNLQHALLHS